MAWATCPACARSSSRWGRSRSTWIGRRPARHSMVTVSRWLGLPSSSRATPQSMGVSCGVDARGGSSEAASWSRRRRRVSASCAVVNGGELRRRCPGWAVGGGILESSPASGVVELRSVSLGGSASAWHGAAAGCVVVGDLRVNVELGFGDGALGFAAGLGVGGDRVGLGLGTRRGLGLGDQLEPGLGALLGGQSWSRLWHAGRTAKPGFKARRAALRGRGGS